MDGELDKTRVKVEKKKFEKYIKRYHDSEYKTPIKVKEVISGDDSDKFFGSNLYEIYESWISENQNIFFFIDFTENCTKIYISSFRYVIIHAISNLDKTDINALEVVCQKQWKEGLDKIGNNIICELNREKEYEIANRFIFRIKS